MKRMSDTTGQPQSSIISELVDAGLPAVGQALEAIELAKAGKHEEAARLMSRFAHAATAELAQEQLALEDKLDRRTVKGKRLKRGASLGRVAT